MELITTKKLPQDHALNAIKRWEKQQNIRLTPEERVDLIQNFTQEIDECIVEERNNNDKFVELSKQEKGILRYYLRMVDKLKYMVGEVILENSLKKRDILLLEMARLLGANVIEEEIPYKTKPKDVI